MLDALVPALTRCETLRPTPPSGAALLAMARRRRGGRAATIPLVARKGRASYLGERSAGHLDPGAASSAILVRCLADAVTATDRQSEPSGEPDTLS